MFRCGTSEGFDMDMPKCLDLGCLQKALAGLERIASRGERKAIRFSDFDAMLPVYSFGALLIAIVMATMALVTNGTKTPVSVVGVVTKGDTLPIIRSAEVLSIAGSRQAGGPAELARTGKRDVSGKDSVRFVF